MGCKPLTIYITYLVFQTIILIGLLGSPAIPSLANFVSPIITSGIIYLLCKYKYFIVANVLVGLTVSLGVLSVLLCLTNLKSCRSLLSGKTVEGLGEKKAAPKKEDKAAADKAAADKAAADKAAKAAQEAAARAAQEAAAKAAQEAAAKAAQEAAARAAQEAAARAAQEAAARAAQEAAARAAQEQATQGRADQQLKYVQKKQRDQAYEKDYGRRRKLYDYDTQKRALAKGKLGATGNWRNRGALWQGESDFDGGRRQQEAAGGGPSREYQPSFRPGGHGRHDLAGAPDTPIRARRGTIVQNIVRGSPQDYAQNIVPWNDESDENIRPYSSPAPLWASDNDWSGTY
jgi:type IV secretory pathway TrbL component